VGNNTFPSSISTGFQRGNNSATLLRVAFPFRILAFETVEELLALMGRFVRQNFISARNEFSIIQSAILFC
jgi:hypothetical protein